MNNYDMTFARGPLAGTRLEIARSKPATTLPNGTPIVEYNYDEAELTPTQVAHRLGTVDVHARQVYTDTYNGEYWLYVGPSIAQQWRSEHNAYRTQRGWVARYYRETVVDHYEGDNE